MNSILTNSDWFKRQCYVRTKKEQIMIELQRILCVSGVFSVLFLFSERLYSGLKLNSESSRKFVHVCTGIISLMFPYIFDDFWEVAVLCSCFMVILTLIESRSLLPSITGIDRKSSGSIYFPLSVIIVFAFYKLTGNLDHYIYPILLLSICDPIAAIIGKKYGLREFSIGGNTKTYLGSFAFLISALLVIILSDYSLGSDLSILFMLILAIVTTAAEAFSRNGADNLFIPLSAIIVLSF